MFEYQPQRHPLQTFQFWFVVLICAGTVAAWRFELISIPAFDSKQTVRRAVMDEPMPPPPASKNEINSEGESTSDKMAFAPAQSEATPFETTPSPNGSMDEEVPTSPSEPKDTSANIVTLSSIIPSGNVEHATYADLIVHDTRETNSPLEVNTQKAVTPSSESESPVSPQNVPPASIPAPDTAPLDLTSVDALIESGDDVSALRQLSIWYWERPQDRSQFQERLTLLSRRIYFHPHPHYMPPHTVSFGDRLETVAKQYHVPWEYLSKINKTAPTQIRVGQKLKVIQGPFDVVVDLSDFELTVHSHGYYVVRMPIGIGKDESTPVGTFRVTDKVVDPTYYGPDGVVANDDPSNPLGEFWIAFSDEGETIQGFGLHGTIDPGSIGRADSRGCLRLHDQDIEDLYHLLTIGSEVVIRR